ncbi:MAG: CHASE2 domain-containing protein [Nostocaceae cyanobacterium]|nr:CHASE2 domain-containing protein [Nostocaceae cyanobacterium]
MARVVVLNLGKGNFQNGFSFVTLQLHLSGKIMQFTGSLPPAPDIVDLYRRWQLLYELLYKARSINIRNLQPQIIDEDDDITIDEADVTHVSDAEFSDICNLLQKRLNNWLDDENFRQIERQLRKELNPLDEIRFIIQSEDKQLRKIPWYIWQFFQDYPRAEVSVSPLNFEPGKIIHTASKQVRILAVLGDSTGIDVEADRRLLSQLKDAEIVFLVEPQRRELDEQLWDKQGWDILFFAGHSLSHEDEETGHIYINSRETLTINQLRNALKKAIERGLQLAIFNSCEGLGLAAQLADLHIPQMIVMREPISDRVAQEFLKNFLTIFADGESFYLAVREARERLQGIETEFPGASWLPVIVQNPAEQPPTWQWLRNQIDSNPSLESLITSVSQLPLSSPIKFFHVLIASMVVTASLTGLRWLGKLQSWELKAFDHLVQTMPQEPADRRILIIGADEEDISNNRYGYPLPDKILTQLLNKLQTYKPAVIGIDLFRDQAVPKHDKNAHQTLIKTFQKHDNIISICAGNTLKDSTAPPQISSSQIGFVDLYDDRTQTRGKDDTVRRYLLSRTPNPISIPSRCTSPYSFSWQLAYRYLKAKGIPVEIVDNNWKFGSVIFQRLQPDSGGYQNLDARGNQLLINYRRTSQIAQQVTVTDVLEQSENFNSDWVKGRVVLIGITAPSIPDFHDTPYGEICGSSIHAHVISQILSAVEDNRPLLWWLPQWGETLWIFAWSFTGGVIIWCWRGKLHRGIGIGTSLLILYAACWLLFTKGGWIPLLPSVLAMIATKITLLLYTKMMAKKG